MKLGRRIPARVGEGGSGEGLARKGRQDVFPHDRARWREARRPAWPRRFPRAVAEPARRHGEELGFGFRAAVYPPRSVIFTQGEPAERMYLIAEGSVRLYYLDEAGEEHMVGILASGSFVGEVGLIRGGLYGVSAVTQETTRLYVIPASDLHQLVHDQQLCWMLIESLSEKVWVLTQRLCALAFRTAQVAVAELLLDLSSSHDASSGESRAVLRLSQREIARATGLSRPTVARALEALCEQQLIEVSRSRVFLKDLQGLRDMVASSA